MIRPVHVLNLGVALCLAMGCSSVAKRLTDPSYTGPFRSQYNHSSAGFESLKTVSRVAIVPTALPEGGLGTPQSEAATEVQAGLVAELRQDGPFEAVFYTPPKGRWLQGTLELRTTEALPSQLLQDVQRQTSADAILFSSLSTYQPYPPLRIGIKLTLVRVHDGVVLWQFDDGFNAGEATTLNDARKYLRESMGIETDPPPALSVDSPQRFIRYGVSRAVRLLKRDFQPAPSPLAATNDLQKASSGPQSEKNDRNHISP
jgi:hypothetical protein